MPKRGDVRLTNEEKILLHLLDYIRYKDEFEVPYALSQEGIGESTGIQRSHVSRSIAKLEEKNLVSERVSHVSGVERMRKTYFLTWDGEVHTKKLAEEFKTRTLKFVDKEGRQREVQIGQIASELGVKLSAWQILNSAKDGVIDASSLVTESRKAVELVAYVEKAPKLRHFYGRALEVEKIKCTLSSAECRVVAIHGISGIGKTSIGLRVLDDMRTDYNVYWYEFHEWDTLRNVLDPLSEFLARLNRRGMRTYLKAQQNIDLNEVATVLEEGVKGLKGLFFFDDFHKAPEQIIQFFHLFIEILERVEGPRVVVMERHVVPFYDRRDVAVKKLVTEVQLGGLSEDDAKKLIEGTGKGALLSHFEQIFKATEGHPLFLELIDSFEGLKGQNIIMKYVQEEIFSKLSDDEKKLLEIASVYFYPVPSEAFFIEEGATFQTLDRLIERSLVREASNERFTLHDFVREFFYSRLHPNVRKKYHREAAKFYLMRFLEDASEDFCIEAIHHFLLAEEYAQAVRMALKNGPMLIARGYLEELRSKLDILDRERAGADWHALLILKGNIHTAKGEWDAALANYRECISIAEGINDEARVCEATMKIGTVMLENANWDDAVARFDSAKLIAEKRSDRLALAHALRGLGYACWRKGKFEEAIANFERATEELRLQKASSFSFSRVADEYDQNMQLAATVCIDLGNVLVEKGDMQRAIEQYTKGMEMLRRLGNAYEIARVNNNIGDAYREDGQLSKGLEYFEEAIRFSKRMGNIPILSFALANAAEVKASLGRIDEARAHNDEAHELVRRSNDKLGLALVLRNYGLMFHVRGKDVEAENAMRESLAIIEGLNVPFELANAHYELARILARKDKAKAKLELESARNLALHIGAQRLVQKIDALKI